MRRWDPVADQGSRDQRRIAAAGAPEPATARVAGFEHYPRFYAKWRRGRVVDLARSFEDLVRSARGGWAAGTTVTATHRAPDGQAVVLDAPTSGEHCASSRWVAVVAGGAVEDLVAAVRTLRALDPSFAPALQRDVAEESWAQRSQRAWLEGSARTGVDGFRVSCDLPAQHDGPCSARAALGEGTWRWDRHRQVVVEPGEPGEPGPPTLGHA